MTKLVHKRGFISPMELDLIKLNKALFFICILILAVTAGIIMHEGLHVLIISLFGGEITTIGNVKMGNEYYIQIDYIGLTDPTEIVWFLEEMCAHALTYVTSMFILIRNMKWEWNLSHCIFPGAYTYLVTIAGAYCWGLRWIAF